jgi:hypothetical protein
MTNEQDVAFIKEAITDALGFGFADEVGSSSD